jgi:glutathione S-transferase
MILVGQYDSPYVRRVAVSLQVLGPSYEHDTRSVFADFDSMRQTNPVGRIPSLPRSG